MILVFRGSANTIGQEFYFGQAFTWITGASIGTSAAATLQPIWFEFFEG